jgi:hypothetical protein
MQTYEMKHLQRGDIVRHREDSRTFIVTGNYGDRVTAVATVDITNHTEWEIVLKADYNNSGIESKKCSDFPICWAIFHGRGGYDLERERALKTFRIGGNYRIIGGAIGLSITRLEIEGIEGSWNSVFFSYDSSIAPLEFTYTNQSPAKPDIKSKSST